MSLSFGGHLVYLCLSDAQVSWRALDKDELKGWIGGLWEEATVEKKSLFVRVYFLYWLEVIIITYKEDFGPLIVVAFSLRTESPLTHHSFMRDL